MRVVNRHEITAPEHRHAYKPHEGASRLERAFKHGEWIQGLERVNMLCRPRHEVLEQVRRGEWIVVDDLAYCFYLRPPTREELEEEALQEQVRRYLTPPPAPRPVRKPQDCVFAKSGLCRPGSTDAGISKEPASNFGQLTVLGTVGALPGSDINRLSRVAGRLPNPNLGRWGLRSLASAAAGANALLLAFWPEEIADGTLYTDDQLRQLSEAATRVRFQFRTDENGVRQVYGLHTGPESGLASVPTLQVQWSQKSQHLEAHLDDGVTLYWTPNHETVGFAPTPYPAYTGNASDILVHPIAPDTDSQIEIYPAENERTWRDYILVFPRDTGIAPLYIVLSLRAEPGVVTGFGEVVDGIWLADADKGQGAPIPAQIADQLRGQRFSNFDRFREAFWIAVSHDATLSKQFTRFNLDGMSDGIAPFTPVKGHVGKRKKFEIHHLHPIAEGGAIYNIENMSVITPAKHIPIHTKKESI